MSNKIRADLLAAQQFAVSRKTARLWIQDGLVQHGKLVVQKPSQLLDAEVILQFLGDHNLLAHNQNTGVAHQKTHDGQQALPVWNHSIPIVYEDAYFWVVEKPSGILVHPTTHEASHTLANIMQGYFVKQKLANYGDWLRAGIVHRLDRDTAGLIVVAKDMDTYSALSRMFKHNWVQKKYYALVTGHLNAQVVEVKAPIIKRKDGVKRVVSNEYEAKNAWSIFRELKRYQQFSLVEVTIRTGRTHQIRVHAEFIKNPIINDPLYNSSNNVLSHASADPNPGYHQYLYAYHLAFKHPVTSQRVVCTLPLPKEFLRYCQPYEQ